MTKFKIQKLDGRFAGFSHFTHRIQCIGYVREDTILTMMKLRSWCVETWGLSCEKEIYLSDIKFERNPHWAWANAGRDPFYDGVFIYLVGPQDLMLFKLKWM